MARNKLVAEYFTRSLAAFSQSGEPFRVLCTLLPRGGGGAASQDGQDSSSEPSVTPPPRPAREVIVLDSSFNPPTTAHAAMVRSAVGASRASSDGGGSASASKGDGLRILLLLAVENADKPPRPAGFPHRLCMMESMGRELLREMGAAAAAVDVGVTKRPYFHDKAGAIVASGFYGHERSESGQGSEQPGQGERSEETKDQRSGETELVFLAGYDTLVRILNPRYYGGQEGMAAALGPLFRRARLRVTMRTDGDWGGREEQEGYLDTLDGLGEGAGRGWKGRVELVDGFGDGVSSSRVREVVGRGGGVDGMVGEEVRGWIEEEGLYR